MFSGVAYSAISCSAVTAAGVCTIIPVGGITNGGTCVVSGAASSMNVDIDGSIDGTNFYSLVDDITANGNYSFVNMPFKSIRVDVDTIADNSITVECFWLQAEH